MRKSLLVLKIELEFFKFSFVIKFGLHVKF